MNKLDCTELIKNLSSLTGVSGYEQKNAEYISNIFKKYCDNVYTDALGSLIAVRKADIKDGETPKKIMVEAHMDEIGLMITKTDEDGFLYFTSIGGIDTRILLASEVTVHGKKDIMGVIGAKPPHVQSADEQSSPVSADKLYIDTGYSRKEIEKIVSVGDTATFMNEFLTLKNDYISTKSQDDRSSVAVLVMVMDYLKNVKLPFDVYFVATVQEEVGTRGAKTAAYSINPDAAIAIDVCHGLTPDSSPLDAVNCASGTVVTKGPNIHPIFVKKLIECLNENGIKYTCDVAGGNTGTDAWAIQTAKYGIPTVLLSLPLKFMHTPVETLSLTDVKATAEAIGTFLKSVENAEDIICFGKL